MTQYSKVIPGHDDVLVRTPLDVRKSTYRNGSPCGDGIIGGDTLCAAKYFERLDGNPVQQYNEKHLQEELVTNGPVVATFTVRQDFIDHVKSNTEIPYKPDRNSALIGSHATTIIGYGVTKDGKQYWKCRDSNLSKDRKFYEYSIEANNAEFINWRTIGHRIENPLPFEPVKQTDFYLGVWEAVEPEKQHWSGALPFDYVKCGAQDIYNEWLRKERNE